MIIKLRINNKKIFKAKNVQLLLVWLILKILFSVWLLIIATVKNKLVKSIILKILVIFNQRYFWLEFIIISLVIKKSFIFKMIKKSKNN